MMQVCIDNYVDHKGDYDSVYVYPVFINPVTL